MTSKAELLKRVNELRAEIQRSRLLLNEALRKRERFDQLANRSIDEFSSRLIDEATSNEAKRKDYGEERKQKENAAKFSSTEGKDLTPNSRENKSKRTAEENESDERETVKLFLQLVDRRVFTSIDDALRSGCSPGRSFPEQSKPPEKLTEKFKPIEFEKTEFESLELPEKSPEESPELPEKSSEESSLADGNVLVLYKDSDQFRREEHTGLRGEIAALKQAGAETAAEATAWTIELEDLESCSERLIEKADHVLFYRLNLPDLWQTVQKYGASLRTKQIDAVVDLNLKMFLTELGQRIKLKLI